MTIKRKDLNETDEQRQERESQERAEQEAAEQARKAELDELRKARHQAELEAAAAKGEAEALKRNTTVTQQAEWSDEQWENEAQKYGWTGQQLKTQIAIAKQAAELTAKPFKEEAERARKELSETREEINRLKSRKSVESVEAEFYEKNPALKAHRKHVDEVLSTYSDSDKVDGDTLKKRLAIAADVVKGRVKETMRNNRGGDSSGRMEGSDEETADGEFTFDPKGTGNEGAAHLMAKVNANFGQGLKHEDSVDVWKKSVDDEGRGVSISMDEDISIAREIAKRNIIGGKRGAL